MPSLTAAEASALLAKARASGPEGVRTSPVARARPIARPAGQSAAMGCSRPDSGLSVLPLDFLVPGTPRNPLNGSWGHWAKHARIARGWRDATAAAMPRGWLVPQHPGDAAWPKRVIFTVQVGRAWDDDAIPGACKPVRDALVDLGVVDGDAPRHGHRWEYRQAVIRDPARRGIYVRVEHRNGPPSSGESARADPPG